MIYCEAIKYIENCAKYGSVLGLDNICRLMEQLFNPQDSLKIIHIAGTNGKGSTGTFIDSILREQGYNTGRFISPFVIEYREIIQYNGQYISKEDFACFIDKVKNAADKIVSDGYPHPTPFEIETAVAFCYFYYKKCDFVLLEVGMGGKDDATNVINKSLISVITSISIDHTAFLGNTLEEIASIKSGIIKENGIVVASNQLSPVIDIINNRCYNKSAELITVDKYNIKNYFEKDYVQFFDYKNYKGMSTSMLGKFQLENAATAIETAEVLNRLGYKIDESSIYNGISGAVWPGRFQILNKNPIIIADGAHNPDAVIRLKESIDFYFHDNNVTFIMGIFKDKDYNRICEIIAECANKIICVQPLSQRGLDKNILCETIKKYNKNAFTAESIEMAVKSACETSDKDDVIVIFGSLSFLGKIISSFV